MNAPYMNVTEAYPIYDTVNICKTFYGKEKTLTGWYTTFRDFAADEKHTFFKSRTAGNSHLAYCNQDSADNVDFVFKAFSFGVRFFAPVMPDAVNSIVVSPTNMHESVPAWWLFDLPKHCGIDFRVQQDVIVENTCLATPAGYGPRGGGGAQPATDITAPFPNQTPWKVVTGTIGDPIIDNRFPFPEPISIARNTSIEANLYISGYARDIMKAMNGPLDWVLPTAEQATQPPAQGDYFSVPTRYGIQVSLFGYREVQQRGQYHAPGAIQTQ
jgi:hypothetical protein